MGWVLEIAKMGLYLSFPVATFHFFNCPEYFEKYVVEKKREMYPHEDELHREELNAIFRDLSSGNLQEKIDQFEKVEKKLQKRAEPQQQMNIT